MKKGLFFIFVCAFFASAQMASAQFTEYTWESYGVSFVVPSTHQVKQNAEDVFESGDNFTWLEMYPYKDDTETAKGMILDIVGDLEETRILKEGAYKVGGYDGYWITCEQSKHPEWQFWYIGFIDPVSDVNFYAIIWYKKNNPAALKLAQQMSLKFKKM